MSKHCAALSTVPNPSFARSSFQAQHARANLQAKGAHLETHSSGPVKLHHNTACLTFEAKVGSGFSGSTILTTASLRSAGRLCRCSLMSEGKSGATGGSATCKPKAVHWFLKASGRLSQCSFKAFCTSSFLGFRVLRFLWPPESPGGGSKSASL